MRKSLIIMLSLLVILLATGCSSQGAKTNETPAPAPEKIIVQAPVGPPTAPLLSLAENSTLPDTSVELIIYKTVEEATARVVKGEADFTVLPVNVAAKLYNKNLPVKLANVSTWGILYLISVDSELKEWSDLAGKDLYVGAKGSSPDVLTRYLLSKNGVQADKVKLTYLDSPEIAQMMINGLVKYAVLPEPLVTQVILNNQQARVVRDFYSDWQTAEGSSTKLPQTGMIVRNDFAKAHPETVSDFQLAYARQLEATVADPVSAAPLVEKHLNMKAPVFIQSMSRTRLQFVHASSAQADVHTYLKALLDLSPDMVGGKLPDEKFFLAN
ncbi:NMT1/THI5 like protein [Sporotomaculum syntrophicum]|uniref:NMT1/THI5 like protein n=1 Tax=Sporotomaculum syntrophicum TaxID=182264 RepID=A0A9D2WP62_9FIRM|nr:ABC transporter substrate-binding protein [Sporotomaculum syntrophicum]KAF1084788.1 NMT1/THI5 like protein [Sporotomaculum syntrophicum]